VCAEVLLSHGRSIRGIASEVGIDESTLRYRLRRRRAKVTDGRRSCQSEVCADLDPVIADWMAEQVAKGGKPSSVRVLYERLVTEHSYTGSYRAVLRYVQRRTTAPRIRPVRRVETRPGLQTQVDWVLSRPVVVEELATHPVRLQAFIMTLSHSRMWAVVWSARQDLLAWLSCHNRAFVSLGGVPATVRIDNLKTGVTQGAGTWAVLHPGYASYAKQLGFIVDPCRVRQPSDKGKVERRGHDVKHLLLREGEHFATFAALQHVTEQRILEQADRLLCPVTGSSIRATWEAERPALQPLPLTLPQPFDIQVHRRVGRDCLIAFEGRQYSVPYTCASSTVEVRGCADSVEIYRRCQLLARFPRRTQCRLLVDQAHYEGPSDTRVVTPPPLGRIARAIIEPRSWERSAAAASTRSIGTYARLVEALS
jgi:transposase